MSRYSVLSSSRGLCSSPYRSGLIILAAGNYDAVHALQRGDCLLIAGDLRQMGHYAARLTDNILNVGIVHRITAQEMPMTGFSEA